MTDAKGATAPGIRPSSIDPDRWLRLAEWLRIRVKKAEAEGNYSESISLEMAALASLAIHRQTRESGDG